MFVLSISDDGEFNESHWPFCVCATKEETLQVIDTFNAWKEKCIEGIPPYQTDSDRLIQVRIKENPCPLGRDAGLDENTWYLHNYVIRFVEVKTNKELGI